MHRLIALFALIAFASPTALIAEESLLAQVETVAPTVDGKVLEWRRYFHEHPELSNREFNTSKTIEEALRGMGMEVWTDIAHTGVVGILHGGKPGPVVAVRADIDALPVEEVNDLPFKSVARGEYRGADTGVMHACGHDTHIAIGLGTAAIFAELRDQVPGTIMFIFQPAEEGAPEGEEGGAYLMLKEGLFERMKPDAIYGLHVWSAGNAGEISYRSGPLMASADGFQIDIYGRQTHASRPWGGIDPIVTAAQVVMGLQTIASRQVNVTKAPSVVSVGRINGGIRGNIIPDHVEMLGTVRAFDPDMREDIKRRVEHTAKTIAESQGARAEIKWEFGYPVTINEPALTERSVTVLNRVVGAEHVSVSDLVTGAEDFSFFQQQVPGFYFFLGATPVGQDATTAPSNHSPMFFVDESTLPVGLKALAGLVADRLENP
ncbi:MAG: amidohydrolase [Gammaproteobacteria bacterium]|jgi:amidohydrolase|nr:amidohydrolase [Gammaproteobacteria bacterium]